MTTEQPEPRQQEPHPICKLLRDLRHSSGMSLGTVEKKHRIPAVVLGAYERGDRTPPLSKLEHVLNLYGYELRAVPIGSEHIRLTTDIIADLRAIADQLEGRDALSALL